MQGLAAFSLKKASFFGELHLVHFFLYETTYEHQFGFRLTRGDKRRSSVKVCACLAEVLEAAGTPDNIFSQNMLSNLNILVKPIPYMALVPTETASLHHPRLHNKIVVSLHEFSLDAKLDFRLFFIAHRHGKESAWHPVRLVKNATLLHQDAHFRLMNFAI